MTPRPPARRLCPVCAPHPPWAPQWSACTCLGDTSIVLMHSPSPLYQDPTAEGQSLQLCLLAFGHVHVPAYAHMVAGLSGKDWNMRHQQAGPHRARSGSLTSQTLCRNALVQRSSPCQSICAFVHGVVAPVLQLQVAPCVVPAGPEASVAVSPTSTCLWSLCNPYLQTSIVPMV